VSGRGDEVAFLVTNTRAGASRDLTRPCVSERLAACANVIPGMESTYWWGGELVEGEREDVVLLKTTAARVGALTERVLALHPYENPYVAVLSPVDVAQAYGAWVREVVGGREAT
jgi:uncharacterized protein involved in tolerance to divalent cations